MSQVGCGFHDFLHRISPSITNLWGMAFRSFLKNSNKFSASPYCLPHRLLLLLLSCFSRVRLCETPQMAGHQAPPSLGFSSQEHWSGLPFPSPMQESESEVAQCRTFRDPMDCSLPGSSIHGIFQARVLEWGAIAFSIMRLRVLQKLILAFTAGFLE